ncbi:hypothetical protein [Halorubrum sp. Ea8]|uniref:hypothetical protein n=1 Tax=Halorubrum sp. Ea8 TaxID=1383841 RepID=UPI001595AD07|nr:hypothetical protein [Halorubrum sp. Ea8]
MLLYYLSIVSPSSPHREHFDEGESVQDRVSKDYSSLIAPHYTKQDPAVPALSQRQ